MSNNNKKHISIVAAISKNHALGKGNQLLYHLPNDMRMFRLLTMGGTIIMGRKTFESFPNGALPNRENIVISRSNLKFDDVTVCHSIEDAIKESSHDNIFIIGGGQIYRQAMDIVDTMYLTIVDDIAVDADVFFPDWGDEWKLLSNEKHFADSKHKYNYSFQIWKK